MDIDVDILYEDACRRIDELTPTLSGPWTRTEIGRLVLAVSCQMVSDALSMSELVNDERAREDYAAAMRELARRLGDF